jgi:hypothetical protein
MPKKIPKENARPIKRHYKSYDKHAQLAKKYAC